MHMIKSLFFFVCLFFFSISSFAVEKINFTDHILNLEECLLPTNHPLQPKLKKLFPRSNMFDSRDTFRQAGFNVITRMHRGLMVASHPSLKGYLIKKFSNAISQQEQLKNFINRVNGARFLKEFIAANQLQHIIVPQKWIYPLPHKFSDALTNEPTYLLIVERIHMRPGGRDHRGENAKCYHRMDLEVLRELCIVLYHFRGLDSMLDNMPFTYHNQIAFIDTEKWNWAGPQRFLHQAIKYLNPTRKQNALDFIQEMSKQN